MAKGKCSSFSSLSSSAGLTDHRDDLLRSLFCKEGGGDELLSFLGDCDILNTGFDSRLLTVLLLALLLLLLALEDEFSSDDCCCFSSSVLFSWEFSS